MPSPALAFRDEDTSGQQLRTHQHDERNSPVHHAPPFEGLRLSPALAALSMAILATRPPWLVTLLRALRWTMFLPPLSPVGFPAGSGVTPPVLPGRWRNPVVLDRNHQDWPRNE